MKKLFLVVALVSFVLALPMYSSAGIIGDVNLREIASSPTGYMTFPGSSSSTNVYLDYDVSINNGAYDEAFCVETQNGPGDTNTPYTLLSIDAGLAAFGLDYQRYLAAAWVADYYYTNKKSTDVSEEWKAGAQIAVWEYIFDSSFNLAAGSFYTDSGYTSQAMAIYGVRPSSFPSYSSNWALAVNPVIADGGTVTVAGTQNYLVHHSVPEPATMLLLGLGLIGLSGVRRITTKRGMFTA